MAASCDPLASNSPPLILPKCLNWSGAQDRAGVVAGIRQPIAAAIAQHVAGVKSENPTPTIKGTVNSS